MPPQKITAKNLQYNTTLPPFLARLRGQSAADPDAPDPILAARRRPPGKKRSASAEAEDAPLVVDERGEAVEDVTVGVDGTVKEKEGAAAVGAEETGEKGDDGVGAAPPAEKAVEIGGLKKKRKIGRVIGAGVGGEDTENGQEDGKHKENNTETATSNAQKQGDSASAAKTKVKKKAKKIKLSFGDEEG
ncbi:hypothetical protein N0V88_007823 [Collariella sp. IMI 366227]|nr:hypothetical protein N0V88_007823 [Collariella sp. IMI 366227]